MLRAGISARRKAYPFWDQHGHLASETEVGRVNWQPSVESILNGLYRLEERLMLKIEHFRGGQSLGCCSPSMKLWSAADNFVRPIRLTASVSGYVTSNLCG
jgi:hypothetical protein